MKKFLSLILCIVMLVSVFTVSVSAVDNYEPKTIEVKFDPITEKCYIPEGYVVYTGDTLILNRSDISFLGDFVDSKNGGEIEYGAVAILANYDIKDEWGNKLAGFWGGNEVYVNKEIGPSGQMWKDSWADLGKAGKYTFYAVKGRDTYWGADYKLGNIEFLTIEVVDPTKVDTIVLPPEADVPADEPADVPADEPADVPADEPTDVPSDEPIDDEPIDDEPIDDEPIDDEPIDDEPTDNEPAGNGWVIWVVIGAVVVAAAVVVIILVSKKKK